MMRVALAIKILIAYFQKINVAGRGVLELTKGLHHVSQQVLYYDTDSCDKQLR